MRARFASALWACALSSCLVFASREVRAQVVVAPLPDASGPAATEPTLRPAADLSAWVGKPIRRITVTLEGNVWNDVEAPPIHDVKPGDPFTPAAARRAMAELLGAGRFARARVSATPQGDGVALVLRAAPRKLIGRLQVDLHGAPLARDELVRELGLVEGGEIVGADVPDITRRLAAYCSEHGFPAAKVDVQARTTDNPTRSSVVVDVVAGAPRVVAERRFDVSGAGSSVVLPLADAYGVRQGDRADGPAMGAADTALEQSLRSRGWYRAHVSHELVDNRGGPTVLRVRIESGPKEVPRFEGNDHYDDPTLTAALSLDEESDHTPSHLADKIRAFYERRGFLDADVSAEVRGSERDAVQVIVFHIQERRRVSVVARRYPCLRVDAVRRLTNGGPRSPGEIGTEIDSYLEDELPGADLFVDPDPRAVSATIGAGAGQVATGSRPAPLELRPDATYAADTYSRALEHVQELYRNEGFLHAIVGPVQVVRARCDPHSPPGRCVEMPQPTFEEVCTYGSTGLPAPPPPLAPALTCRADPARGVECSPRVQLVIPIELGPRTRLWDVAFTGVKSISESEAAEAGELPLGDPVSTVRIEDARRRIVEHYKELGFAYVDVKYTLEPSPDNSRARVRFDVSEGDRVVVRAVVIRGLTSTRESVVSRRIAFQLGDPYRTSDVNKTRERLETLGVFSDVRISLSDPYVPEARKTVYVDVVERLPRYLELRPGFSTGEGVRGTAEYDERDVLGYAIGAVFRAQVSYLPDFLILDPQVATNYQQIQDRLARRLTMTVSFPDVGLGPQVRGQAEAIYVRDLERDFALDKVSGFASLVYRPTRNVTMTVGQSVELNNVLLFQFNSLAAYLACNMQNGFGNQLAALLRVPDGASLVVAQRMSLAWDRRDNLFNAHRGTFVYLGAELVNSSPQGGAVRPNVAPATCPGVNFSDPNVQNALAPAPQAFSHFVRLSQTFAGYIPIVGRTSLALELRLGENVRTASCQYVNSDSSNAYCTYPDRLFFMGGFDSMRGWLQDTFMPQEYANQIAANHSLCMDSSTNCLIPLRGGNLMINPRAELRFPLYGAIDGAIFADFGNLWVDPAYVFDHGLTFRADVGPGVRLQTPVATLVFDYGVNVTRRFYEDFGAFHFAIGLF